MASFAKSAVGNRADSLESTGRFGPISILWDYENEKSKFLGLFGLPTSGKSTVVHQDDLDTHLG